MKVVVVLILAAGALVFGCSNKKASWDTQEQARRLAIENSSFNAKKWRLKHAPEYRLIERGDSTISATCPQGDGWATVDLEKGNDVIYLKCSTVSETIGCMTKEDFSKKSYASQDGECNQEIPFPLPKIVK